VTVLRPIVNIHVLERSTQSQIQQAHRTHIPTCEYDDMITLLIILLLCTKRVIHGIVVGQHRLHLALSEFVFEQFEQKTEAFGGNVERPEWF
jgi:hypothetical protein